MKIPSWLQNWIDKIKKWLKPNPTPNPDPDTINVIPVRSPFIAYGNVNTWMKLSATEMEAWMKAQNAAKLDGIMIEWFGFSEDSWEKNVESLKSQFLVLLPLARKYYQRIWCVLVNWGDDNIKAQSDAWIQDILNWFKANTKPTDFIAFEMAAEWGDDQGARWCGFAETTLAGYPLGWNKGCRPTTADSKYSVIDYHCASTSDIPAYNSKLFIDCDHSITIGQLSDADVTSEKFNPTKVTPWATTVIKDKKMSVGLYGFNHKTFDTETIKALGKIRDAISPEPTPNPTPTPDQDEAAHGLTDVSKVTLVGGAEWRNASKTVKTTSLTVSGSLYYLYWELHSWEGHNGAGGNVDGDCDGMVCAVYKRPDGTWMGGKFDHCPKGRTGYQWELKHVVDGYKGHIAPSSGAELGLFIASYDGAERSTIQWTKWP
jgi:hypothetical protein